MESSLNKNCLNTIRLIAALEVVIGHTTRWLSIPVSDTTDHIMYLIQGVPVFFMLSGFLIWHSIGRLNSFKEYALKRFWRLFPELWISVIIELLVVVIMYDKPIEWGKFLLFGISEGTFTFYLPSFLRDYGVGCPNGALWTIACLIKFYFIAWFIYKLMKGKPFFCWGGLFLVLLIFGHITAYIPSSYYSIYYQSTLPFLWLFVFGLFIADKWELLKHYIVNYWYLALILAVVVEFSGIDIDCSDPVYGYKLIRSMCILIWILGFAFSFPRLNISTDISYPIYLYHMTIVNILYIVGYRESFYLLIVILLFTSVISYFSTIYIGTWSKKQKMRLQ